MENFNIFVGSETGLLKASNNRTGNWVNLNNTKEANKQKEIVKLCWGNKEETEICTGLRDETVVVYKDGAASKTLDFAKTGSSLKGLERIGRNFLTCSKSGSLKYWSEDGEIKVKESVGDNICCMKYSRQQQNLVATGGKENDLKLWDLETSFSSLKKSTEAKPVPVFEAKNVPHDWLKLRVPIWVLDIGFIPDSQTVVTSTAHHQVRLYDIRNEKSRPVLDMKYGEAPIMALSVLSNGHQVLVGNSHGQLGLLDVRGRGHLVQAFKGCTGGIRDVCCVESEGVVISCGLDRYLRIHDIKTKNLQKSFYLKSRLNCLLVRDNFSETKMPTEEEETSMEVSHDKELNNDHDENNDDEDLTWFQSHIVSKKVNPVESMEMREKLKQKKKKKARGKQKGQAKTSA